MRGSCDKCGCARNECECEDDRAAIADWAAAVVLFEVAAVGIVAALLPGLMLLVAGGGLIYAAQRGLLPRAQQRLRDALAASGLGLPQQERVHTRAAWWWLAATVATYVPGIWFCVRGLDMLL